MGNLSTLLLASGVSPLVKLTDGKLQTFWRIRTGSGIGTMYGELTDGNHLHDGGTGTEIAAALDARYGSGAGEQAGTGAGEAGNIDLSPLYQANGWAFPVSSEDTEDVQMIVGAFAWAQAAIAKLPASNAPAPVGPPPPATPPGPSLPAPTDNETLVAAYEHSAWLGVRPAILKAHGVVGPGVRTAIFNGFQGLLTAAAEDGLINEDGSVNAS
jgi:hypothetical protein